MQASRSVVGKRVTCMTKLHSQSARPIQTELQRLGRAVGRLQASACNRDRDHNSDHVRDRHCSSRVSAAGPTSSSHRDSDAVKSRCRGRGQPRRRRAAKQSPGRLGRGAGEQLEVLRHSTVNHVTDAKLTPSKLELLSDDRPESRRSEVTSPMALCSLKQKVYTQCAQGLLSYVAVHPV